ncbi:MAG: Recombinase [Candidatus Beckwithbacteria bacterium GW2011_GWA2_43_10]|uniref:Recombinase n=1 Tax=Candidatus Beckwithbacteria bacterium GW2011_GWA2_43_10 TaxID=1618369 RepID=A0A0G1EAM3_9BACT|nr:MAG: Recombinase [Candidatus Beckwithbacteria bacterium GW2011_GWA2_43_10]
MGIAPPGYFNNRLTRKMDLDPKTSQYVKKAWQLYSTGQYSYQQLADWLFKKGVTAKGRDDGQPKVLAVNAVYSLLSNPFYYGEFKYNGEIYQGVHQPLITKDLFDQVQGVILSRSKNRKTEHNFELTNLIKCSGCGYMITAEEHKKYYKTTNRMATYVYYHCSKKSRTRCNQPYITEPNLVS